MRKNFKRSANSISITKHRLLLLGLIPVRASLRKSKVDKGQFLAYHKLYKNHLG